MSVNGPLGSICRPWFAESLSEYQARMAARTPAQLESAAAIWRAGLDQQWRAWRDEDARRREKYEQRERAIDALAEMGLES